MDQQSAAIDITVSLPPRLWWLVATDADALRVSVADLIVDRERRRYAPPDEAGTANADHARGPTRGRVLALRAQGLAPAQIARTLHCTPANVRYHLREADKQHVNSSVSANRANGTISTIIPNGGTRVTVKKITTAAQKGGVGKTTTNLNLARAAVTSGLRTLVVDADPQGNLSSVAAAERATPDDLDLADVIAAGSDVALAEAVRPGVWDGLDVVAGSSKLSLVRDQLTGALAGREHRLREAVATVEDDYDLVLIDVGPNLDLITINSLTASDRVLIVTEPGLFAADGIAELHKTIGIVQQYYNPALRIAGVLVNRVEDQTSHDQYWIEQFSADIDNVLTPVIPKHTWIRDAQEVPKGLDEWGTRKARAIADIYAAHLDTIRRS